MLEDDFLKCFILKPRYSVSKIVLFHNHHGTFNLPHNIIIGWTLLMDSHDNLHSGMQMDDKPVYTSLEHGSIADLITKKNDGNS